MPAGCATPLSGSGRAVERLPDRLAIERSVGPDHHEGQCQQRIDAGTQLDLHEIAELHIGDEDAEHEDLDHRPWAQPLDQHENAPQMARRTLLSAGAIST